MCPPFPAFNHLSGNFFVFSSEERAEKLWEKEKRINVAEPYAQTLPELLLTSDLWIYKTYGDGEKFGSF